MSYGPVTCSICHSQTDSYVYHTCDKCLGARSAEELSKLSTEDQIKLRFELRREESRIQREQRNLREQCKHVCLSKKHLTYRHWHDDVVDDNIHSNQEDSFVWCSVCGKEFGWACPSNPKGYCEYPSDFKEEGIYGCSILYCAHCKKPKNRFSSLDKDKVSYDRPKDEVIDDIDLMVIFDLPENSYVFSVGDEWQHPNLATQYTS